MKRKDLNEKLAQADVAGVWAFTPPSFSTLLGGMNPAYLKVMMKRLSDQGVLIRAAKGVYVNPHARSQPADARRGLLRFLRPREISYVSLESKLSEAGAISQITTALSPCARIMPMPSSIVAMRWANYGDMTRLWRAMTLR